MPNTDRFNDRMTTHAAIDALTGGNKESAAVLMEAIQNVHRVESGFLDDFIFRNVDELRLHDARLGAMHRLFCGGDIVKTLAVIRAWQMGYVSLHQIDELGKSIDAARMGGEARFDLGDIIGRVADVIPAYGRPLEEPARAPSPEQGPPQTTPAAG